VRTKVCEKDEGWSVGLVYDPRELTGVTTARPGVAGVLHLELQPHTARTPAPHTPLLPACLCRHLEDHRTTLLRGPSTAIVGPSPAAVGGSQPPVGAARRLSHAWATAGPLFSRVGATGLTSPTTGRATR
jgi:hypothetical protein